MLRSLLPVLLAVGLLAPRLSATWSIILIDTRTGEIAVASATCIENFDLAVWVPVVVVGKGAGCAQSYVDPSGANRLYIRDQLVLGTDPAQILAGLASRDPSHQTRQYGMVDVQGRAIGFSGTGCGAYASDRTGRVGDIVYAIQGNVLTGGAVLGAAEVALFTTPGGVSEKLMAAMEAAYSFGGDGRCSCADQNPTGCGSPPPNFRKSADVGFMIIARPGDTDGGCDPRQGCASGGYYMRLNVRNQPRTAVDPVIQLRGLYDAWKQQEQGRPDHFLSTVSFSSPTLPLDGRTSITGTIVLNDREGNRITTGGANVQVTLDPSSTTNATPGAVTDNGDGTYTFPLTAGSQFGRAYMRITVDDGSGARLLSPLPEIRTSLDRLWVNRSEISASRGGRIDFSVQPGASFGATKAWVLLASMSGTSPGIFIWPFYTLPLNPDPLFDATVLAAFNGVMPELIGVTSARGVASTSVTFPPGLYSIPAGRDISWAYALFNPVSLTSNPVTISVVQ